MSQLNVDRYEALASRALGVKGPGSLGQIQDDVFPSLLIDANAPFEMWALQRLFPYMASMNQAAVAAENAILQLRNTSTDALLVVDWFVLGSDVNSEILVASVDRGTTGFYAGSAGILCIAMDGRVTPESLSGFAARGTSAAGAVPVGHLELFRISTQAVQPPRIPNVPIVLAPGDSFCIGNNTANSLTRASIRFHLRDALPGELS